MCGGRREIITNIKVVSIKNINNKPRSTLGTKYKAQNHKQKIKRREKQKGYKKLVSANSLRTNLISINFAFTSREQESQ